MSELVLAINYNQIQGLGILPFNLSEIDAQDYAYVPRTFADSKAPNAIMLGVLFPQILGYFQLQNSEGKYLAYQRKGKEKGLFGQWSIGVGGHVSHEDLHDVQLHTDEMYPDIATLIYAGAVRELREELGIDPRYLLEFNSVDDFIEAVKHILVSRNTPTSSVHVGLPMTLDVSGIEDNLVLEPAEFCNFKWVTVDELKADVAQYEDWSSMLINAM